MSGVYIGTDEFAAAVLDRLAAAGRCPDLVITRPDARRGRGRKYAPPPVASAARELGIETLQPEQIGSEAVSAAIERIDPPVLSLCAYGAIVREPLLSRRPILNLHPSLLPRWRGAAPIERALMAGDVETGVSIIRLVEELDAGPIAAMARIPIDSDDDAGSLGTKLVEAGAELLGQALDDAATGALAFSPQATEGVTYAERIEAADRMIDLARPVAAAERLVRALAPRIGARLRIPGDETVGVRSAAVAASESVEPGRVEVGERLLAGCADGALEVLRLVPPGGREMDASEWLRGRR